MKHLVLASGSRYRRDLLKRLLDDFSIDPPNIDENPLAGESGEQMARRLAHAKALQVAERHNHSIIIGSDQVAILRQNDGTSLKLGKPGSFSKAARQLALCAGNRVDFFVACCVLDSGSSQQAAFDDCISVRYKKLSSSAIERYLQRDKPYDCAGSIRTEGLGIALLDELRGSDPGSLIGLPLIALAKALEKFDIRVI
ncbi:MAG: Maf family protein [Gammaproteobacteria bacterium]|nr:Maf family protein [Gammaproteobacteria bacterium]